MTRSLPFALLLLLPLLRAGRALADSEAPPAIKQVVFEERGPLLTMTLEMPELIDEALRRRLRNGFASTLILKVYLYREGAPEPLGLTLRRYTMAFDPWDKVYVLRINDSQGELNVRLQTEAEALARLTRLEAFPFAPPSALPPQLRHFVEVVVEVNPISAEYLAEVRRRLSRARGAERLSGGETFLGSFASMFLNRQVGASERVLRFRSQPFYRVEPKR